MFLSHARKRHLSFSLLAFVRNNKACLSLRKPLTIHMKNTYRPDLKSIQNAKMDRAQKLDNQVPSRSRKLEVVDRRFAAVFEHSFSRASFSPTKFSHCCFTSSILAMSNRFHSMIVLISASRCSNLAVKPCICS